MDLMAATSCQDSHFIASPKLLSIRLPIAYKWLSEPFGPALSHTGPLLPPRAVTTGTSYTLPTYIAHSHMVERMDWDHRDVLN